MAEFDDNAARGESVEFRILGPLEVAVGAQPLELGGSRQQVVLATLLLSANTVVTLGRLQEAIYGENLPPTARSQAQISISSLRRLFTAHGHGAAIATRPYGYAIQVGAGQLDAQRFGELVAAAAAARDAGDVERAVAGYRDALRLWRGPALDGLDSEVIRAAAMRLDEQRMAAIEDRLTVELDLGRHHELIGELGQLVEEFPLREGLRGQLMLALYRCDRTADALQVYRRTRRTMIDELGIEPSERLQQLERAILTGDPALDPPARPVRIRAAARPVPRLLPTDIADFTGRAEQLEQIQRRLSDLAGEAIRLPVPVVVIVGQGGVGKTSTAVHASHALAGHFLDGQLFADLHGGAAHPVGPMQVLERFLRALGVPGAQIPEGLDERAEMYRNLVADRRILVVLDDAVDESQVAPLLPGSGTAAVMITSRRQLAGLAGATHIETDVLDAASSLDLLGRIAGADRVHTQSAAAAAVAGHCGHLPLALRIAGARLATRPHWDIQRLADRLADETRRLELGQHDAAQELLTEALALARAAGSGRIEIQVLQQVGEASLLAGELPRAVEAFELALAKNRDLRDPIGEAYLQRGLGVARLRQGESGPARRALQRALEYAGITGEPLVEARTLLGLSELALATGDPGQAVIIAQRASAAFRSMGTPLEEARAQTLLARAHGALGDRTAADAASAQAAALAAHLSDGQTA